MSYCFNGLLFRVTLIWFFSLLLAGICVWVWYILRILVGVKYNSLSLVSVCLVGIHIFVLIGHRVICGALIGRWTPAFLSSWLHMLYKCDGRYAGTAKRSRLPVFCWGDQSVPPDELHPHTPALWWWGGAHAYYKTFYLLCLQICVDSVVFL